MKHPVSIICVKTGTKYSKEDVGILYKMVKRNCTLPFIFYCLTDNVFDLPDNVVGIEIDKSLDLEKYWWKICLFNLGWNKTVLYMDLDVIIQKNINYVFTEQTLKVLDFSNIGSYYPFDGRPDNILLIPPISINTSVMLYNPFKNKYLFDIFVKDTDYNMIKYYGFDRFVEHNQTSIAYFDFKKDYYCRRRGNRCYDLRFVDPKTTLIKDPRKTFCIVNQRKENDYVGMEEYLL